MPRTITINLHSPGSVKAFEKQITNYKKDLERKARAGLHALADAGIEVAKANCGEYGQFIVFSKKVNSLSGGGAKGEILAVGTPVKRLRAKMEIDMNPLLMAEFGSGFHAEVLDEVPGVGQGTFPGQTHAFDEGGWWYVDFEGNSHRSTGETPTHPMHNAALEIIRTARAVFAEVFANAK